MVLTATVRRTPRHAHGRHDQNVGDIERAASLLAGGTLGYLAARRDRLDLAGVALMLVGGELVFRGATGHCPVYGALGIDTAHDGDGRALAGAAATVNARQSNKVERTVTINRTPEELYHFWRQLDNLPRFMEHLEAVTVLGPTRSRWMAKAPAGRHVEWEAEIINDVEHELIAWKSVGHSDVPNAGSVHFAPAPGGRGTEVKVVLDYEPPGGRLGTLVAKLFGEEPGLQVREDLRRFKQLMEAGEVPTTEGQPSCR